jgi:hypothetical protein
MVALRALKWRFDNHGTHRDRNEKGISCARAVRFALVPELMRVVAGLSIKEPHRLAGRAMPSTGQQVKPE